MSTNYFLSDRPIERAISLIPKWRRWLVFLRNPSMWLTCAALNRAGLAAFRAGDMEAFSTILRLSDQKWAELFGIKTEARNE